MQQYHGNVRELLKLISSRQRATEPGSGAHIALVPQQRGCLKLEVQPGDWRAAQPAAPSPTAPPTLQCSATPPQAQVDVKTTDPPFYLGSEEEHSLSQHRTEGDCSTTQHAREDGRSPNLLVFKDHQAPAIMKQRTTVAPANLNSRIITPLPGSRVQDRNRQPSPALQRGPGRPPPTGEAVAPAYKLQSWMVGTQAAPLAPAPASGHG